MQKRTFICLIIMLACLINSTPSMAYKCYEYYKTIANEEEYDRVYKLARDTTPTDFKYCSNIMLDNTSLETYYYVAYDHPEIMWSASWLGGFNLPYERENIEHDYNYLYAYINQALTQLGKMKKCSKLKKIKKIHNYVAKRIKYKTSENDSTRTLSRVLITNKGCCASYAKLFKLLCDYYNIKSIYIANKDHAFNYVQYKNKWYGIDCCWDRDDDYYFMYGSKKEKEHYEHEPKLWFNEKHKFPKLKKALK